MVSWKCDFSLIMARVIEITSWFQSVTDPKGPLGSFLYLRIYYFLFEDILQSNTTWCFLLIGSSVLWSTLAPPHHRTEYIKDEIILESIKIWLKWQTQLEKAVQPLPLLVSSEVKNLKLWRNQKFSLRSFGSKLSKIQIFILKLVENLFDILVNSMKFFSLKLTRKLQ